MNKPTSHVGPGGGGSAAGGGLSRPVLSPRVAVTGPGLVSVVGRHEVTPAWRGAAVLLLTPRVAETRVTCVSKRVPALSSPPREGISHPVVPTAALEELKPAAAGESRCWGVSQITVSRRRDLCEIQNNEAGGGRSGWQRRGPWAALLVEL